MLLNALPDHRLHEIAGLWLAMGQARQRGGLSARQRRRCLAALQAQLLLLKCALGLYLNQASAAAVQRELARRGMPLPVLPLLSAPAHARRAAP